MKNEKKIDGVVKTNFGLASCGEYWIILLFGLDNS